MSIMSANEEPSLITSEGHSSERWNGCYELLAYGVP